MNYIIRDKNGSGFGF